MSAALARMLNSLHAIRPQWLSSLRCGGEEPPAVVPLPLNGPAQPSTSWFLTRLSWMERMVKPLGSYVRTVVVLVVLLCFPKLVSAFIAFSIRLVLRLCSAIVIRLLRSLDRDGWLYGANYQFDFGGGAIFSGLSRGCDDELVIWMVCFFSPYDFANFSYGSTSGGGPAASGSSLPLSASNPTTASLDKLLAFGQLAPSTSHRPPGWDGHLI